MRGCAILLINDSIHVDPLLSPRRWDKFPPHHFHISLSVDCHWTSTLVFKKMISLRPMAHHTVTFDTEGANYMLVKLGLCLTSHILLINVSTEVEMCFTEKDQVQQSRVVFNALSDVNTKGSSLFLICCSLSLQNLNFVGKQMNISVHYASNGCP